VALAELGWVSMGIVDTVMVGRLGPEEIGAVSLGGVLFLTVVVFGLGVLLGLDPLVARAFGAGSLGECHRWLVTGVWVSLAMAPLLAGAAWLAVPLLASFGIHEGVRAHAVPYLETLLWSALPLLVYGCVRRYLQAMNLVVPVMAALVSANLVNAGANWIFVFGNLGAPALGVVGAGWATCVARVYLAALLLAYAVWHDRRHRTGLRAVPLRPEWARVRRLTAVGVPAALQISLEVGAFALATALAARLTPEALAAHQVAMVVASTTFMVPLGIASAGAVRVGQALGRGDPVGAATSGWTAILFGGGFMAAAGLVLVLAPGPIARTFTADEGVVRVGISLLLVAALFQLFDGVQVVVTGALRGAGETRIPMLVHLVAYYAMGLPLGYALCFGAGWGVRGIWTGLSAGLIGCGVVLLRVWAGRVRRFRTHAGLALGAGAPAGG
jgi:MATE family multidrug resistance protein